MSLAKFPTLQGLLEDLTRLSVQESSRSRSSPVVEESRDVTTVSVPWVGTFHLTGAQRTVVRELVDSLLQCADPEVEERVLLVRSKTQARSLEELFRGSPAWGVLILRGSRPGRYRLPSPPEGESVEGEITREAVDG